MKVTFSSPPVAGSYQLGADTHITPPIPWDADPQPYLDALPEHTGEPYVVSSNVRSIAQGGSISVEQAGIAPGENDMGTPEQVLIVPSDLPPVGGYWWLIRTTPESCSVYKFAHDVVASAIAAAVGSEWTCVAVEGGYRLTSLSGVLPALWTLTNDSQEPLLTACEVTLG